MWVTMKKKIIQKSLSITSVLELFSSNANVQFLKIAGLKYGMTIINIYLLFLKPLMQSGPSNNFCLFTLFFIDSFIL